MTPPNSEGALQRRCEAQSKLAITCRHSASSLGNLMMLAVVAILLTIVVLPPTATLAQPDEPQSVDDLFELFEIADQHADFVVVIDTSASMGQGDPPIYPAVVDAYGALVAAIRQDDHLSAAYFAGASESALFSSGTLATGDARQSALGLPSAPTGQFTDIGAAIETALDQLERADASLVQTVIILTDGRHDPDPSNTSYPESTGPGWSALKERAGRLEASRRLSVVGLSVGTNSERTDVALVSSVFSSPQIIDLPADQLAGYFEDLVRRSQLEQLRLAIDREARSGQVLATQASDAGLSGQIETEIQLTSEYIRLPVEIRLDSVTVTGQDGPTTAEIVSSRTFQLQPGDSAMVRIRLDPALTQSRFQVPQTEESQDFNVTLAATTTLEPRDLLAEVGTKTNETSQEFTSTLRTSRTVGMSLLGLLVRTALGLAVLAILYSLYRRYLRLPRLSGVVDVGEFLPAVDRYVTLKGKRMRLNSKNVPGVLDAQIDVYTRRGRQRRTYALPSRPSVRRLTHDDDREVLDAEFLFEMHGRYELDDIQIKFLPVRPDEESD